MAIGVVMSAAMMERPGEIDSVGDFLRYFGDIVVEYGRDYFLAVKEKHSLRYFLKTGDLLGGA